MTDMFDQIKTRLINEGKFTEVKALMIINKSINDSFEYWKIEGKVHPVGVGRQTDYLGLILEQVFAPMNLEITKG